MGMAKQNNSGWRSWVMIAIIAVIFFSTYKMNPNQPKINEITQLEFFKAVDEGKIVEPVVRHIDRDDGETYLDGEMETNELDDKGSPKRVAYRVNLVPGENESLMNDLFAAQVKVEIKETKSSLSPFVTQLLFFFGFSLLFYWLFLRRMGGGGGVLGFGKSRAMRIASSMPSKMMQWKMSSASWRSVFICGI